MPTGPELATAPPPAAPAPTPLFRATLREVVTNYTCAAALLLMGFWFYSHAPAWLGTVWADATAWLQGQWPDMSWPKYRDYYAEANAQPTLRLALIVYLVALPLYYATFPDGYPVKSRLFWGAAAGLLSGRRPSGPEAVALRAVAVKAFFMPLMLVWLVPALIGFPGLVLEVGKVLAATGAGPEAEMRSILALFVLGLTVIIIVDLSCFTVAYGVEHPRLGNEIKSVEPTLLGWAVALMCYPPFNPISAWALGWYETEQPPVNSGPWVAAAVGALMLVLMGTYAWASVALGLRGGNLVHRGVVDRWPYSVIRHPAYLCKNLFWCVGAVPAFVAACYLPPAERWFAMACVVGSSAAWFGVYTLRALTEERHLMRDPAYQEYCKRVKYRYIPGVW
jgi:protein-S-isoprenylcysteine O-methyltransferase Ste14